MALLVVAEGVDPLKSNLTHQASYIAVTQRKHVQVVSTSVTERIAEASQSVVDMFRSNLNILAAVHVAFAALGVALQQAVVISVVQDQNSVVLQHGVVLRQSFASILFAEEVCEGIA